MRRKFGNNHPYLPEMLDKLARQELAPGNVEQARQHAEEAVAKLEGNTTDKTEALLSELAQLLADIEAIEGTGRP